MASEKYITDKPVLYKSGHTKKTSPRNFYIIFISISSKTIYKNYISTSHVYATNMQNNKIS